MIFRMLAKGLLATIVFFGCAQHVYSDTFADADVGSKGFFSLTHSSGDSNAKTSISVREKRKKEWAKPIGDFNALVEMNIVLDGVRLPLPQECKRSLLDVNYIRLENVGPLFRFWVQGGDGSEAYQVVFSFSREQAVKCRFLPDEKDVAIEPMFSQKKRDERIGRFKSKVQHP